MLTERDKKMLILNSSIVVILTAMTLIIPKESFDNFYTDIGQIFGYKGLSILLILLLLAYVPLIFYIRVNNENYRFKTNIFQRMYYHFYYPKCVVFHKYIWRIEKDIHNEYVVSEFPICPECKIPISENEVDFEYFEYTCGNCGKHFDSSGIYKERKTIEQILNSIGFKYFKDFEIFKC